MIAMILAAGRGERLRPLTDHTPKPVIQAGGKPLIVWHIENLKRAGITDIIVNTAWLDHVIHETLGDGSAYGVNIMYSDEGTALETAGGIMRVLPLLRDEPFIVVNGDIWCDYDFSKLSSRKLDTLAHLVLVENPEHNGGGDFAIIDGMLANMGESMYTFSGIGLYTADLFDGQDKGVSPLGPILRAKANEGLVSAEVHDGRWTDVGTVERLEELREAIGR